MCDYQIVGMYSRGQRFAACMGALILIATLVFVVVAIVTGL